MARWRSTLALICAMTGVGAVFPLLPWSATVRDWRLIGDWPLAPFLVAAGLAVGAWLLPRTPGGARRPDWHAALIALGALCLAEPLVHLALLAWSAWRPDPGSLELVLPAGFVVQGAGDWVRLLLLQVAVPAVVEEWFFRGRLQPWLAQRVGTVSAISLTALWFAACHGSALAAVVAIPLGLVLGVVSLRTGSLYACIVAHAAHNLLLLLLGGLLVARPDLALALWLGGAWLLVAAMVHRGDGADHLRRRGMLLACGIAFCAAAGLHLVYRLVHERAWTAAAQRLLADEHIPAATLMQRLERAGRTRLLTPERRARLAADLLARHGDHDRQAWLATACDPDLVVAVHDQTPTGLYTLLRRLASYPAPHPALTDATLLAAAKDPLCLVDLAQEDPLALPLLLPLDHCESQLVSLLEVLPPRERLSLVESCRMAWGRPAASALHLAMDPARVTPRDRYHLQRYDPGAASRIEALAAEDPERAAAWRR